MIKEAQRHGPPQPESLEKKREQTKPIDIIVETPKGSHVKYKFDVQRHFFKLHKFLPVGSVFPYCFGFFPDTKAEDGDPLDVLMISDVVCFPGCVVPSRLIGVLEAEQTEEDGSTVRNDRIIAVAAVDTLFKHIQNLSELEKTFLDEITHFFVSYNEVGGVDFRPLGVKSSDVAYKLVEKSGKKHRPRQKKAAA